MSDRDRLAREIVEVGRRLQAAGLIAGTAGNFSARLSEGYVLITPAGRRKGELREEDMVHVTLDAGPDEGQAASTELPFHRAAYLADENVGAVVHTHAPALIACGLLDLDIAAELPEVTLGTGPLVTVPLLDSGSEELGEAVGQAVRAGAGVILLRNHGAVSVGPDPSRAADRMELAELAAYAVLLGEQRDGALARERIERLLPDR